MPISFTRPLPESDVRSLAFDNGSFDVALAHTCLTHVPGPASGSTATLTFRHSSRTTSLTLVDRGADTLASWRTIGVGLADALKAETRRRVDASEFYGSITFASLIASKPA